MTARGRVAWRIVWREAAGDLAASLQLIGGALAFGVMLAATVTIAITSTPWWLIVMIPATIGGTVLAIASLGDLVDKAVSLRGK